MRDAVAVIAEQLATWDAPFVELDIFGTADPERIFAAIDGFARDVLHARIAGYLFQATSVSSVHGVVLDDGRELVIKAKPPAATNPDLPLDRTALEAIMTAQRTLHAAGFPCPQPIVGPLPLGTGLATVETYLAPADPAPRDMLVRGLVEHMALLEGQPGLRHFALPSDRLFTQPHSKLFHPSEADTGWVRDLARRARDIGEAEPGRTVVAHCDWRIEHVKVRGDRIVATYDWDSLAVVPETRAVGINAHGHTADWSQTATRKTPTYDQVIAFIDDYGFTTTKHRAARAWAAYFIAYGAWITIEPGKLWAEESWAGLLEAAGERLLR